MAGIPFYFYLQENIFGWEVFFRGSKFPFNWGIGIGLGLLTKGGFFKGGRKWFLKGFPLKDEMNYICVCTGFTIIGKFLGGP